MFWGSVIFLSSTTVVTQGQLASVASTLSAGHVTQVGFLHVWSFAWWLLVKGWHMCEFGILFLLLLRPLKSTWLAAGASFAFAATDEIHQLSVRARGGRVSDWLIDGLGIALFAFMARRARSRPAAKAAVAFSYLLSLAFLSFHPF